MKKILSSLALTALLTGCQTTCCTDHGMAQMHHPDDQRPHPGPAAGMMPPSMTPPPGPSPGVIYFHEASQKLAESRRDGFLTNDQFADLLEKLMGDTRQILIEETRASHPGPRPPQHPPRE